MYPAFCAALLRALLFSFHPSIQMELLEYCKLQLKRKDPELKTAAGSILLKKEVLEWGHILNLLKRQEWWGKSVLITQVKENLMGIPSYESLVNIFLKDKNIDVSLVCEEIILTNGLNILKPFKNIPKLVQISLKSAGLIGKISSSECPISEVMISVLGSRVKNINWKILMVNKYKLTLTKIIRWKAYSQSDATAFINLTDTINDLILDSLFNHDKANIGNYTLGKVGSVLNPKSRFAKKYQKYFNAVKKIHDKRLESDLSHPIVQSTGKETRFIKFKELKQMKKVLTEGYLEIWTKW